MYQREEHQKDAPAQTMPPQDFSPLPLSSAPAIAARALQPADRPELENSQAEHRIRLVNAWGISRGMRVLELGCGQGNATEVLAEVVGPADGGGHVDAVDPGAPDYGAPYTLAQAQQHLSAGPIGSRITWHHADPVAFLDGTSSGQQGEAQKKQTWDVAVLAHCIWYFADPEVLGSILAALRGRVRRVCIAEYALHATEPAALPHVLAVLARGAFESCRVDSSENVRTPLGPRAIREAAAAAGWAKTSARETVLVPGPHLLDGHWEVGTVVSPRFVRNVDAECADPRLRALILSARDATVAAVEALGGAKVRTMDVWVADFEEAV